MYGLIEQFNKTLLSSALLAVLGIGFNRYDYYTPEWTPLDATEFHPEQSYVAFRETVNKMVGLASAHNIQLIPVFMPSKLQLALETKGTEEGAPLFVSHNARIDPHLPINRLAVILSENGIPV